MIIEYFADPEDDRHLEKVLTHYKITNWFNPDEGYYVIETDDDRVVTVLHLLGLELSIH